MFFDDIIFYAIHNDTTVINSLAKTPEGIPIVNRHRAPSAIYPLIEYQQIGGSDVAYADEAILAERVTYQLTYYGDPNNIREVIGGIKAMIRRLGFRITFSSSVMNQYTHITHHIFHFQSIFDLDGYDYVYQRESEAFLTSPYANLEVVLPDGEYWDEGEGESYEVVNGDVLWDIYDQLN